MSTRHSPRRRSESRNPSTSQRRSPPSTMAWVMARSRSVRSAPMSDSTSSASRIRGSRRTPRTSGRPRPPRERLWRVAMPRGTGLAVDVDVVAGDQVAIEARDRSQPALDRRRREPRRAIGDAHHVLGTGLGTTLRGDEGHDVFGPHLGGVLLHHREEDAQVMGIGPHRVGTGPADDELQELVDQPVADPVHVFTVGTDVTLE